MLLSKAGQPAAPSGSMSGTVMALIAQSAKRLALGDRVYEYHAGQYLMASVDLPVTGASRGADPARLPPHCRLGRPRARPRQRPAGPDA
ncbi:MAG: AraC family transcriptional regulator N-terminal domain-containing protein [Streptosporangiaceae bacterium]